MARPELFLEDSQYVGAIVLSVIRGNKRLTDVSKDLNKTHQDISRALNKLAKKGWLIKENNLYKLDRKKAVTYFSKEFDLDKKILEQNIDIWLNQIAFSCKRFNKRFSINQTGMVLRIQGLMI